METKVFDQYNFFEAFDADLNRAQSNVVLQCPYLSIAAIKRIKASLERLVARGIRVCIFTKVLPDRQVRDSLKSPELAQISETEQALKLLEGTSVHIDLRPKIHEKVTCIDASIIWDGSLNALSYNPAYTKERATRTVDLRYAMDAILRHYLDKCGECLKLPQPSRTSKLSCESVGEQIVFTRVSKRLSQTELAKLSGVDRGNLARIESGQIVPRIDTLLKIFNALDIVLSALPHHAVPYADRFIMLSPPNPPRL